MNSTVPYLAIRELYGRVAFSPTDDLVVTTGQGQTVRLWRQDGTAIKTLTGHEPAIWGGDFSPDGKTSTSAAFDKTFVVWNLDKIMDLDAQKFVCDWISDYLRTSSEIETDAQQICQ